MRSGRGRGTCESCGARYEGRGERDEGRGTRDALVVILSEARDLLFARRGREASQDQGRAWVPDYTECRDCTDNNKKRFQRCVSVISVPLRARAAWMRPRGRKAGARANSARATPDKTDRLRAPGEKQIPRRYACASLLGMTFLPASRVPRYGFRPSAMFSFTSVSRAGPMPPTAFRYGESAGAVTSTR